MARRRKPVIRRDMYPEGERRPDERLTVRCKGSTGSSIQGDNWGRVRSLEMTQKIVERIDRDEGFDPPPPIIRVRRRRFDDEGDNGPSEVSA